MLLASGSRFGAYEILTLIGQGGMGEVYRARDSKLSRDVAIKLLPADVAADWHRLTRFERDAQTLAASGHLRQTVPSNRQVIRVSRDGGHWPRWSRSLDMLCYRRISTSVGNHLRSVFAETTSSFRFSNESLVPVTGFNVVTLSRDFELTPDGKRLLLMFPADGKASDQGLIIAVLNWTDELRQRIPTK